MAGVQWWVVLGPDGGPVSEGTVVADPLPDGLSKVKVDGPSTGRSWDANAKAWGAPPAPDVTPAPDVVLGQVDAIARDDTLTAEQQVAAILDVLPSTP